MIISIICAMNSELIIGNKGELPWYLPSDLKRFKEITTGHPVIMGRKTFESILSRNKKPLPDRLNIVITRDSAPWSIKKESGDPLLRDCVFVQTLQEAIAQASHAKETFVIGGAEIYAQALPRADRLYLTRMQGVFAGDARFPQFDMDTWKEVYCELINTDTHPYTFTILKRVDRIL